MTKIELDFSAETEKDELFKHIESYLVQLGLKIAGKDDERPWGGFFVIEESDAEVFITTFFPHLSLDDFSGFKKLSPKILLVAPEKRLSWQYHFRRSEIWKVIGGKAAVAISDSDEEKAPEIMEKGTIIELEKGERHRLIGTDEWGIVAEIWRHTDPDNPSDEDDIVRLQDDYGR